MVWMNAEGICERKTLFWMKKEADRAGFKGTRTGPMVLLVIFVLAYRIVRRICIVVLPNCILDYTFILLHIEFFARLPWVQILGH